MMLEGTGVQSFQIALKSISKILCFQMKVMLNLKGYFHHFISIV